MSNQIDNDSGGCPKPEIPRRDFLGLVGAGVVSWAAFGIPFAADSQAADLEKLSVTQAESTLEKLPFEISISKVPFENPPEYFGGGQGNPYSCVDFPICPVEIDGEYWVIFKNGDGPEVFRWKGTNIEDGKRQPDGLARFPAQRPYLLGGMWYDDGDKRLYAPMHCEYYEGGNQPHRQIHLASSTDKGLTWRYEGPIVTRDDPGGPSPKSFEYSGLYWDGGAGDFLIYVDRRGGYVYLYAATYAWMKTGGRGFIRHQVARCAMGDKMIPGKWWKFYNGRWDQPGQGGKATYVNAYYVMYNSYLGKYIGMNYGGGLAVCNDLSKQDWTPGFKIRGNYWGCDNNGWAWHVTDAGKADIFFGGQTLYLYKYWGCNNPQTVGELYKVELSRGETPNTEGYTPEGLVSGPAVSMDPMSFHPIEPLYESADPIESRRTRRVHCTSEETSYSGKWKDEKYAQYFEKSVKASGTADGIVQFSFTGADVYWRAVKGPDCGKADVSIDGLFQKTVDCYVDFETADQFAFIKTGLASNVLHTMKVVVRGDKNPLSKGTMIRHLLFEYSAESYRASDGFSSVMGKNGWFYQQNNGSASTGMVFDAPRWIGDRCENWNFYNEVGTYHMFSVVGDVMRKWVAPHAGSVRIEGQAAREDFDVHGIDVAILVNEKQIWPASLTSSDEKLSHDITLAIRQGETISFVLRGSCLKNPVRVLWDPVITYVETPKRSRA